MRHMAPVHVVATGLSHGKLLFATPSADLYLWPADEYACTYNTLLSWKDGFSEVCF
jgi:hypothetical protein